MLRLQRLARRARRRDAAARRGPRACCATTAAHTGGDQPIGAVRVAARSPDLPGPALHADRRARGRARCWSSSTAAASSCGDLDTHDAPCRFLAEQSGVRVLVGRLPARPRAPVPGGVRRRGRGVRAGRSSTRPSSAPTRPGSASAATRPAATWPPASRSRRPGTGWPLRGPAARLPGHRGAARRPAAPSCSREGFYLTPEFMDQADAATTPTGVPADDPRLSPLYAELPAGLAPALRRTPPASTRSATRARRTPTGCARPGSTVELTRFADQIHGFFNIVGRRPHLAGREPADRRGARLPRCPDGARPRLPSAGAPHPRPSSSHCSRPPRSVRRPTP